MNKYKKKIHLDSVELNASNTIGSQTDDEFFFEEHLYFE